MLILRREPLLEYGPSFDRSFRDSRLLADLGVLFPGGLADLT